MCNFAPDLKMSTLSNVKTPEGEAHPSCAGITSDAIPETTNSEKGCR